MQRIGYIRLFFEDLFSVLFVERRIPAVKIPGIHIVLCYTECFTEFTLLHRFIRGL